MLFKSKKANLWYCCLIACTCMAVNGYDSSTFNAAQGSVHFMNYFGNPVCFFFSHTTGHLVLDLN